MTGIARITVGSIVNLAAMGLTCAWLLVFGILPEAGWAVERDEALTEPRLYWRNGDALSGRPLETREGELSWNSDLFADALSLRTEVLHMIRFPAAPRMLEDVTIGTQIIETRSGNRFYGRIVGSQQQYLSVETSLYGSVSLDQQAVSLIANPVRREHVYSGPKGLRGWSTLTYGRRLEEWEEVGNGQLKTRLVAAELYRQLPASGSVDIDVELLWRSNPSFQIRFLTPYAQPSRETVKVETRVNGYVIQTLGSNGRFRQVDTMSTQTTKCRLLLRWNHAASELSVFRDREYLGKITVDRQSGSGPCGIYLKNTGPQLTLARLEVRASSSLDLRRTDPGIDTVLLADNSSLSGSIAEIDERRIVMDLGSERQELNWDQIAEISFRTQSVDNHNEPARDEVTDPANNDVVARDEAKVAFRDHPDAVIDPNETEQDVIPECVFQNGETLKGRIVSADEQGVTLQVPAILEPITCPYGRLERIVFHQKSLPPKASASAIEFRSERFVRLHGALAASPAGRLAWQAIGATRAVEPVAGVPATVVLAEMTSTVAGVPQEDLLYFRNGDMLPCQLYSVNGDMLDISSRFTDRRQMQGVEVSAVELSTQPVDPWRGFDDRWLVEQDARQNGVPDVPDQRDVASRVQFTPGSLKIDGPATVTRRGILAGCDRVSFGLQRTGGTGGVFVHVELLGDSDDDRKRLPFYFMDKKLFVLGSKRNAFIPCLDGHETFDVVIETRDPFRIAVNDKTVYTVDGSENGGPWTGVSFKVSDGPLFGAAVRRQAQSFSVAIHDLHVSQTRRHSIRQATSMIDAETMLTVPRNRKAPTLSHLAIGTNGDAIRGNLMLLERDRLVMQHNSSPLHLRRDQISGVVWLVGDEFDAQRQSSGWRIRLRDTTTVTLSDVCLDDGVMTGHHSTLGECRLLIDDISSVSRGAQQDEGPPYSFMAWRTQLAREPDFDSSSTGSRIDSPLVGKPIDIAARMLDSGQRVDLNRYQGRVVVLDFWATWCAPCVRNMPGLIQTIGKFSSEQVQLIAVNQGEDARTVGTVVQARQWNLQVAMDETSMATRELAIESLPSTIVIDQQGNVSAVFVGVGDAFQQDLTAEIKRLLGEG